MKLRLTKVPEYSLFLAIAIYAGFGSPTPDGVTTTELLQGTLLVTASAIYWKRGVSIPRLFVCFFLGSSILGIAAAQNNSGTQIARDLIAHIFFCAVVFIGLPVLASTRERFLKILAVAGAVLSLRFLQETGFRIGTSELGLYSFDGFLKLNTDPTVTLSAGLGIISMTQRDGGIWRLALLAFGLISCLAIGFSALRGPLAILVFVFLHAVYFSSIAKTRKLLIYSAVFLAVFYFLLPYLSVFVENFANKTAAAGFGEKSREFYYILFSLPNSLITFLFGDGFGALIDVGGRTLPFTHSALTYYYKKCGVLSLALLILIVVRFLITFFKMRLYQNTTAVLMLMIVMYGLFINPHYKYMTFGLIFAVFIAQVTNWKADDRS